ncbi:hypothetical protein [Umezawaea tangerina]|uniref:hypothetical protein n=1 Tax=Umezawaea tangerina TaxID=84725 RepID=UPI0014732239|nr:hypothetical protein [Umezawaea tangerina]
MSFLSSEMPTPRVDVRRTPRLEPLVRGASDADTPSWPHAPQGGFDWFEPDRRAS